jgi:hypothetical protein
VHFKCTRHLHGCAFKFSLWLSVTLHWKEMPARGESTIVPFVAKFCMPLVACASFVISNFRSRYLTPQMGCISSVLTSWKTICSPSTTNSQVKTKFLITLSVSDRTFCMTYASLILFCRWKQHECVYYRRREIKFLQERANLIMSVKIRGKHLSQQK